ncbi:tetratricopeptide repeat protein [Pseudenhygromyxa sp. WMMC2535]|uniref:tetratricopeptide repeat protein n=1 Tax=Pseudenhygromyxa sp. WMMC2535 TaxID=2712867 RepID=UPI00155537BA|nr:tetratricopeptide repeat protein [Pseudenhygromyxa sp. WMMC2535]NVB37960.1 tetratricopeptide repeat protein [Pseudenhygromyxa sp. WMMC2535]
MAPRIPRRAERWLVPALIFLPGCEGEVAALFSLAFGTALGAWMVSRDRQNRALYAAENLRHAIATGQQREIEMSLRKQLALAEAGEAVSVERQWLARAQLGGLLVAEWRLDEARAIYGADDAGLSSHLQALANFGRHELALLSGSPDDGLLETIRSDRDACLQHVPPRYRELVTDAWRALEGLCLVRMGRAREAAPLLERGLSSLAYNPARVVYLYHLGQAYEHLGERQLAAEAYEEATKAFPGTRLASEAKSRRLALVEGQHGEGMFRRMLPEAPVGSALLPAKAKLDDEP